MTDHAARDQLLEEIFGPPEVAAADLHELRAWTHKHTALNQTAAAIAARELCRDTDPTWPARALTNESIKPASGKRPRTYGGRVDRAESTADVVIDVAHGNNAKSTRKESTKDLETLWPAQHYSFVGWMSLLVDINQLPFDLGMAMRTWASPIEIPYVHPAVWMTLVWAADSSYTGAVHDIMLRTTPRELWKFATTVTPGDHWFAGMAHFPEEWLDMFPRGEIGMWLRSVVCNGWMTSHQVAVHMNRPMPRGARTTEESWID